MVSGFNAGNRIGTGKRAYVYRQFHLDEKVFFLDMEPKSSLLLDTELNGSLFEMDDDAVFKALADASRRKLLDRLHRENGQMLRELCEGLDMTRQAVAKHLAILKRANLVSWKREGRERLHFINPVPINDVAERWISKFEQRHLRALSALKTHLEAKETKES